MAKNDTEDPWKGITKQVLQSKLKDMQIPYKSNDNKPALIEKLQQKGVSPEMVLEGDDDDDDNDANADIAAWDEVTAQKMILKLKHMGIRFKKGDNKEVLIDKLKERGVTPETIDVEDDDEDAADTSANPKPASANAPDARSAGERFLKDPKIKEMLPMLTQYAGKNWAEFESVSANFKARHPHFPIARLWFFVDFNLRAGNITWVELSEIFIDDPETTWEVWDWGLVNVKEEKKKFEKVEKYLATAYPEQAALVKEEPRSSDDDEAAGVSDDETRTDYNSQARRRIRERNRGIKTSEKANKMTVEDPETGEQVEGEIMGISPTRRMWMAVALPSLNDNFPKLSRALYVDCSKANNLEAYRDYVSKGANHQLRASADDDILKDCNTQDFELNCVLQMPWGKNWHTHAFGIPHFKKDREFMLFSKSILTKQWGASDTEDILRKHMQDAGQTAMTKAGEARIRARAWNR